MYDNCGVGAGTGIFGMPLKPLSQTPAEIQKSFLKSQRFFEIFIFAKKKLVCQARHLCYVHKQI